MSVSLYDNLIEEITKKGEVKVPFTDCDAQFYLEDVLREKGIRFKKIVPHRNRGRAIKTLIYKIQ